METKDRIQICKVVAQAILADAQITDSERELLEKLMDRYELDDDQRKDVLNRNLDDDSAAMARELSGEEPKNELLVELALTVAVDGEIAKSERELLNRVAEALSVSQPDLELLLGAAIS